MPISSKLVEEFPERITMDKYHPKDYNTPQGYRIFPSKPHLNNSKMNFRVDKGSVVEGKHQLILQAYKNAEDKGVDNWLPKTVTGY